MIYVRCIVFILRGVGFIADDIFSVCVITHMILLYFTLVLIYLFIVYVGVSHCTHEPMRTDWGTSPGTS